jgi:pSer/pThr/pTyr-binding forkhead associated (FHA) protein/anti-anti-sigma regulatory factor
MKGMLRIVVQRGGEVVEDRTLQAGLVSIGRAADNDVVVADSSVSSHHLVVKRGLDGSFTLIDQSWNGTFHDGRRISTLKVGRAEVITFAGYEVTIIPSAKTDTVEDEIPDDRAATVVDDLPEPDPDGSATGQRCAELRLRTGDGRSESVRFSDTAIIGRDEDCDLRIASREISRKHAFVYRRGDRYLVKRLSRVNPVRVAGRVIGEGETSVIEDGDVIEMSGFAIELTLPSDRLGEGVTFSEGRQPNIGFSTEIRRESREIFELEVFGFLGEKAVQHFDSEAATVLDHARVLVIELGYLVGIDEPGIAALVRLAAECDRRKIRLTIRNMAPRALDVVRISNMRRILEPYLAGEAVREGSSSQQN